MFRCVGAHCYDLLPLSTCCSPPVMLGWDGWESRLVDGRGTGRGGCGGATLATASWKARPGRVVAVMAIAVASTAALLPSYTRKLARSMCCFASCNSTMPDIILIYLSKVCRLSPLVVCTIGVICVIDWIDGSTWFGPCLIDVLIDLLVCSLVWLVICG